MKTHIWLTGILVLAGMTSLAGVADASHPTWCKQSFEYPPVCCAYLKLAHIDAPDVRGLLACGWVP